MNEIIRFESNKDWWIVAILRISNLLCLATIILIIFEGQSQIFDITVSILLIITVLFTHSILSNTYYQLEETELIIRMGIFTKRIPVADITEMKMKVDVLSSAALSIQRVLIKHKNSRVGVQISPVSREKFIELVKQRQDSLANNS